MSPADSGPVTVRIRPIEARDAEWVAATLRAAWASTRVVSRGGLRDASRLPGFVAESDGAPVGLVTYVLHDSECEVVTLNALVPRRGVGTLLLEAVGATATTAGCHRLWLNTTNDNTTALRFYQRRGWDLVGLYPDIVRDWRTLKPELPQRGQDGIPILHVLELELRLDPPAADSS